MRAPTCTVTSALFASAAGANPAASIAGAGGVLERLLLLEPRLLRGQALERVGRRPAVGGPVAVAGDLAVEAVHRRATAEHCGGEAEHCRLHEASLHGTTFIDAADGSARAPRRPPRRRRRGRRPRSATPVGWSVVEGVEVPVGEVRRHDVAHRPEEVVGAPGVLALPVAQHLADAHPLQVLLVAAQGAGNDRERAVRGPALEIVLGDVGERPDDDVAAVVADQLRRHPLEAPAEEHVHAAASAPCRRGGGRARCGSRRARRRRGRARRAAAASTGCTSSCLRGRAA